MGNLGVGDHGAWADSFFFFLLMCFAHKTNNKLDINAHLRRTEPVEMKELRLAQKLVERRVRHLSAQLHAVQEGQWSEDDQLLFMMVKG